MMKLPIGGGAPVTLASAQPGPQHIAVDATNVYWTNIGSVDDTGSVMAVAKEGGTPMALATAQRGPFGIAVDATNVYWTDVSRVMKAPIAAAARRSWSHRGSGGPPTSRWTRRTSTGPTRTRARS